ncbi:DUF3757 domain-containing protein [Pseudomonas sp. LS1212]|uniref:DUF3757 domain-containing protein n=1 Tax=Pseudomonas sp. LS1212 TaxID=2972478 RepID=UPI00215CCF98|nr:DUF3757 domain-containing protein [Pseudomonas sp. LS1212]UVJ45498.1 DUF3757 domain-containing protein [Pseudomonas sp. LS1212]
MRYSTLPLLFSVLFAGGALAADIEYCPDVSSIKNTHGVYTAPTANGMYEWIGVAQGATTGDVTEFSSGLFYPDEQKGTQMGVLSKCTYKTQNASLVDLRYRPEVNPDIRVKLEKVENWEEKEGHFGIKYFECESKASGACAFSEIPQ